MATVNESSVSPSQAHHRRVPRLQPISSHVPPSMDRHFEQYLIDHHHFPKLPSIGKQPLSNRSLINHSLVNNQELLSGREQTVPDEAELNHGPISRLLNSEQYRRSQTRLIEYRQRSKIPGIALASSVDQLNDITTRQANGHEELTLPLKDVLVETTRATKQQDETDFADDESVLSHESDRHRRAKHWIKEHQFFFTEYQ